MTSFVYLATEAFEETNLTHASYYLSLLTIVIALLYSFAPRESGQTAAMTPTNQIQWRYLVEKTAAVRRSMSDFGRV